MNHVASPWPEDFGEPVLPWVRGTIADAKQLLRIDVFCKAVWYPGTYTETEIAKSSKPGVIFVRAASSAGEKP